MRINVSLPVEDVKYMEVMQISPSKLMQTAIKNAKNHKNSEELEQNYREFEGKIEKMVKKIEELYQFIEQRGLENELIRTQQANEQRRIHKNNVKNDRNTAGAGANENKTGDNGNKTKELQKQIISEL